MRLCTFAICLALASQSIALAVQRKCCGGENLFAENYCVDGSNISLDCELTFVIPKYEIDEIFKIEENGNLTGETEKVAVDDYCITNHNETGEAYIICYRQTEEAVFKDTKIKVGAYLGLISVFFIVLTILLYLMVPKLFDTQGICMVHSLAGLGIGYLFLGIIQLNYLSEFFCFFCVFVTYTGLLYAFFWLNILSFHIWRTVVKPQILNSTKKWLTIYHAFGIGGTSLCLAFLLTAQYSQLSIFEQIWPGITHQKCWFASITETFIYFYGPISVLLVLNIVYYIWTVAVMWIYLSSSDEQQTKKLKYKYENNSIKLLKSICAVMGSYIGLTVFVFVYLPLRLCVKLFFIMGITWILEVVSALFNEEARYSIFWIFFDCVNALQGLLIFLILVVFRARARKGLANRSFFGYRFPASWRNITDEELDDDDEEEVLSLAGIQTNISPPAI